MSHAEIPLSQNTFERDAEGISQVFFVFFAMTKALWRFKTPLAFRSLRLAFPSHVTCRESVHTRESPSHKFSGSRALQSYISNHPTGWRSRTHSFLCYRPISIALPFTVFFFPSSFPLLFVSNFERHKHPSSMCDIHRREIRFYYYTSAV